MSCLYLRIFQVLYEIAFTHGHMEKGFNLFTDTPRQLVLKSAAVSDIPSSVLVVGETDDCLNLLTFAQEMPESKAEVIMPLHPSQIFVFRGSLKGVVKSVSLKGDV